MRDVSRLCRLTVVGVVAIGGWTWVEARGQSVAPAPAPPASHRATINRYCVSCHNDKAKTGGLSLETADLANVGAAPDVWEKVVRKVRVGMMPPQGAPAPDAQTRGALVASLTTTLDAHAKAHPDPGRALVHRLNRTEYGNAVRDLLALEVDPAALLPADDSAYGFDNVADVLGVSPLLLERYISAAGKVSALAVGDPEIGEASETFRVRQDASQDTHVEGLPIGTVGGMLARTTLPLDGEYVIQPRLFRTNLGAMRGLEYPHQLEITVDGARVHLATLRRRRGLQGVAAESHARRRRRRTPLTRARPAHGRPAHDRRGLHREAGDAEQLAAAAVRPQLARHLRSHRLSAHRRVLGHRALQPDGVRRHAEPPPYLLVPSGDGGRRGAVRAPHRDARWRAPRIAARPRPKTCTRLMAFYADGRRGGELRARRAAGAAAHARQRQVRAAHRARSGRRHARLGRIRSPISTLASRLSFFLWSSIPDDELLQGGGAGAAAPAGGAAPAGARACSPTRSPRRWSPTSPGSGSTCAT